MANNVFLNGKPVEIERKYLIKIPDIAVLKTQSGYNSSFIEQIYIAENGRFNGDRIRKRVFIDGTRYYRTHKEDINGLSRIEIESEISAEEYERLAQRKLPDTRTIRKTRHCFEFNGQILELDIYEFWDDKATLEAELESEEQSVELPDFIEVIADVTGNKSYSNYSLSCVK